jgi:DNA polymerase (family 10)
VHTDVSGDGQSPLEDIVASAKARGYRVMAITDHAEGTVSGVGRDAFLAQRAKIRALQKSLGDSLTVLHGVELNIGREGQLDYDAEFRAGFDFCLASVHDHFDLDRAAQTKRIVTAMHDSAVRMIGHLSARMIGARPGIDLDLDAVLAAAEETGTALEINGGLPRLDMSVDALRRARASKVTFVVTSDAHETGELERVSYAVKNAERAWIPPDRVANASGVERLVAWAARPSTR